MLYPLSYGGGFSLAGLAHSETTCQAGRMGPLRRQVECELEATVLESTGVTLSIAVANVDGLSIDEHLEVTLDGAAISVSEVIGPTGTRWHVADVSPGALVVRYRADVEGRAAPAAVAQRDRIEYVRPSRYVQSDDLLGSLIDSATVDTIVQLPAAERVTAARHWVAEQLDYVSGSTGPTDGLPEVIETGEGVCRDFAHLLAGLLRATDLPARVVSVYAPQLDPMDFHAVVEAAVDDHWVLLDATGLAPRHGMLRISTGRDAADNAFLVNEGSSLELTAMTVKASASTELAEDPTTVVHLG